jgi:FtsZ-binding cell division protein ZapB
MAPEDVDTELETDDTVRDICTLLSTMHDLPRQLQEKEQTVREQYQTLREKNKTLQQKDQKLQENEQVLRRRIRKLKSFGPDMEYSTAQDVFFNEAALGAEVTHPAEAYAGIGLTSNC